MPAFICRACANQYPPSDRPPERCMICEDARQYVPLRGQDWTTLDDLSADGYQSDVRALEPNLWGIGIEPELAIGQRALLVRTDHGNVLWDPPGFLDDRAIEHVSSLGGLAAISASHPHFYGVMVEWAHAFEAPILLPEADRVYTTRPDPAIERYREVRGVVPGITLVRCAGHFPGSAVLHWRDGDGGRGALLTGDTIMVVQDRRYVSFLWSYPNLIPLDPEDARRVVQRVSDLPFDRIYGGWWKSVVTAGAERALRESVERYVRAIGGDYPKPDFRPPS